mmetsp:Transcript_6892/g.29083  ORF Transcript_6892/g.29083 Transcript_6892/m.29083 type:complete len:269 (-) Transcript_6892:5277-6083(-)
MWTLHSWRRSLSGVPPWRRSRRSHRRPRRCPRGSTAVERRILRRTLRRNLRRNLRLLGRSWGWWGCSWGWPSRSWQGHSWGWRGCSRSLRPRGWRRRRSGRRLRERWRRWRWACCTCRSWSPARRSRSPPPPPGRSAPWQRCERHRRGSRQQRNRRHRRRRARRGSGRRSPLHTLPHRTWARARARRLPNCGQRWRLPSTRPPPAPSRPTSPSLRAGARTPRRHDAVVRTPSARGWAPACGRPCTALLRPCAAPRPPRPPSPRRTRTP